MGYTDPPRPVPGPPSVPDMAVLVAWTWVPYEGQAKTEQPTLLVPPLTRGIVSGAPRHENVLVEQDQPTLFVFETPERGCRVWTPARLRLPPCLRLHLAPAGPPRKPFSVSCFCDLVHAIPTAWHAFPHFVNPVRRAASGEGLLTRTPAPVSMPAPSSPSGALQSGARQDGREAGTHHPATCCTGEGEAAPDEPPRRGSG